MRNKPVIIKYKVDKVKDRLLWHRIKMMCRYKDKSLKDVVLELLSKELFNNHPHF